jgi:hypothetical protein
MVSGTSETIAEVSICPLLLIHITPVKRHLHTSGEINSGKKRT